MKKISVIATILAATMLLCACSGKADEKKPEDTKSETGDKKEVKIDFDTVIVSDFVYGYIGGDDTYIAEKAEKYVSSKPSVATVDKDGKIDPKSPGVTLVGYEKDGKATAVAVCVFPEGEGPDRASGGVAEVVAVGKSYVHTSPVGGAEYFSSNSAVVDVSGAPELKFVGSGYACITCASASRPFTYSFIVYDRTVEK